MEETPGRSLTWEERQKLKEKLALLKQEYNKTFNRLQRSQRAEQVKSHVKKKIAEQNCLLDEEQSGMGISDLRELVASGVSRLDATHVSEMNLNMERRVTVSFNLQPEFFNIGSEQHENPLPEDKCGDQKTPVTPTGGECAQEKNQEKSQRSREKLKRSILELKERKSTCGFSSSDAFEPSDPLCRAKGLQGRKLDPEEQGSPVFKRDDSILSLDTRRSKSSGLLLTDSNFMPEYSDSKEFLSQAVKECSPIRATGIPSCLSYKGDKSLSQSESPTDNASILELTPSLLVGITSVTPKNPEKTAHGAVCKTTEREPKGRTSGSPPDSAQFVTVPCSTEDKSSTDENSSLSNGVNEQPSWQNCSENQVKSVVLANVYSTAVESPLSSCTVVEGLLFPVEYYVRTTRRMSNCQRKIDLEAVINSHLGTSRKGSRRKLKQMAEEREVEMQQGNNLGLSCTLKQVDSSNRAEDSIPTTSENSTADNMYLASCHRIKATRKGRGKRKSLCKLKTDLLQAFTSKNLNISPCCSPVNKESQKEKKNYEQECSMTPINQQRPLTLLTDGAEQVEKAEDFMPCGNRVMDESLQQESTHNLPSQDNFLNLLKETLSNDMEELKEQKTPKPTVNSERIQTQQQFTEQQLTKEFFSQDASDSCLCSRRERPLQGKMNSHAQKTCISSDSSGPSTGVDNVSNFPFHLHNEMLSSKSLVRSLDVTDFHLPDEEFGFLKLEKLKSPLLPDIEPYVAVPIKDEYQTTGHHATPSVHSSRKQHNGVLALPGSSPSQTSNVESHGSLGHSLAKKELSSSALLSTPASTMSLYDAGSQLPVDTHITAFPILGLTPVSPLQDPNKVLPVTFCRQEIQTSSGSCIKLNTDTSQSEDPGSNLLVVTSRLKSCVSDVLSTENATCVPQAKRTCESKVHLQASESQAGQVLVDQNEPQCDGSKECCNRDTGENKGRVESVSNMLHDTLEEGKGGSLQLISMLQTASDSCAVDVNSVWWESADSSVGELHIVTACESSISLWKPEQPAHWKLTHTWSSSKMPVIQVVPLPDTYCCICVALGHLAIEELWLLFSCPSKDTLQDQLVKSGYIYSVLGLAERRIVSSSRTAEQQTLEIISLSEGGRIIESQTLMSPEESVLAFGEVKGEKSALIGTTVASNIVIWNLVTGQLLKMISIGKLYQAPICHKAYSESGLLFIVLSHPYTSDSQSSGGAVFTLIGTNPKQADSIPVMSYILPERCTGRYLEGDVEQWSAAAVLSSGSIAIWDLSVGLCTALLPPACNGVWAMVRWLQPDSCLMAGKKDGSVYLYKYQGPYAAKG